MVPGLGLWVVVVYGSVGVAARVGNFVRSCIGRLERNGTSLFMKTNVSEKTKCIS